MCKHLVPVVVPANGVSRTIKRGLRFSFESFSMSVLGSNPIVPKFHYLLPIVEMARCAHFALKFMLGLD